MTDRSRVIVSSLLATLFVVLVVTSHPFVSYETMVDYLVIAAAVPATLFVVLYPLLSPQFWQTWIGRALFTSSAGLAALLDLTLLSKWFELLVPRELLSLILALIAAGAWLKLGALVLAKRAAFRSWLRNHRAYDR